MKIEDLRIAQRMAKEIPFFERGTSLPELLGNEFLAPKFRHTYRASGDPRGMNIWMEPEGYSGKAEGYAGRDGGFPIVLTIDASKLVGLGCYDVSAILQQGESNIEYWESWYTHQWEYRVNEEGMDEEEAEREVDEIWEENGDDPVWLAENMMEAHFMFYDGTKYQEYLNAITKVTYWDNGQRKTLDVKKMGFDKIATLLKSMAED